MATQKPNFTDVDMRPIVTELIEKNDFEYLSISLQKEDGSAERLMLLNMYDAKKLAHACDLFISRTVARNFSDFSGHLSANERAGLHGEDE